MGRGGGGRGLREWSARLWLASVRGGVRNLGRLVLSVLFFYFFLLFPF